MKKIIYVLVFALFFSCEKEGDSNDNSSNNSGNNFPSQNCGTVTMNIDYLTTETFTSSQYEVDCSVILTKDNGVFTNTTIDFWFKCQTIIPGSNITTSVTVRHIDLHHFGTGFAAYSDYFVYDCNFENNTNFATTYSESSSNPESITLNITNIDEINYKFSGDFTLIDPNENKPTINVVFSDVPITIGVAN